MKLYDNAVSPFARKVRMALEYKKLPFEAVDAIRPEMREELASVNPRVEVPVLQDGDITVSNSSEIIAYLEHRYPEAALYPPEPAERVAAREWERRSDTQVDAILHDISFWKTAFNDRKDSPPEGIFEAAQEDLNEIYDDLEGALAETEFVCGAFSIADIALFPHLSSVRLLGVSFSAERHPRLLGWYRRMRKIDICQADLERARQWLSNAAGEGLVIEKIFWRGDRIEWMLARGFHEWFFEEIRKNRVTWPRRG